MILLLCQIILEMIENINFYCTSFSPRMNIQCAPGLAINLPGSDK